MMPAFGSVNATKRRMSQRNEFYRVMWHLAHDAVALTGLAVVISVITAAVLAPYLAPQLPTEINVTAAFQKPSLQYLFGTDALGRDMLSRILYGAQVSLQVGVGSVALAAPIGVALGLIAGYSASWVDNIISRMVDVAFAFPPLLLALLMVAVLGTDFRNLIFALALIYVPRFARVVRSSVLSIKNAPYVEAAQQYGCRTGRIMTRHILPNAISPIIVQATVSLATAVLAEASLSFLGLGVQPPRPAWGSMLSSGKMYMEQFPHLTFFPGLAIAVTVLGFNFLGDGFRDALDPSLRH